MTAPSSRDTATTARARAASASLDTTPTTDGTEADLLAALAATHPDALTGPARTTAGLDSPVLADAPLAVCALDLLGRVCLWNTAAEQLFGWSEAEVMGTYAPFICQDDIDRALENFALVVHGTGVANTEFRPRRADGTRFGAMVSASLLRNDEGRPLACLLLVRDVTRDVEARLRRREAEQKWRALALRSVDRISFLDADGHITQTAFARPDAPLGYPDDWWEGRSGFEALHPDDVDRAATLWAELVSVPGLRLRAVLRGRHFDGHFEQVEFTGVNLLDDPSVGAVVIANRVVSQYMQTEKLVGDEAAILELIARDAPLDEVWQKIIAMVEYHTGGSLGAFAVDCTDHGLRLCAAGSLSDELRALADAGRTVVGPGHEVSFEDIRQPAVITDFAHDPRTAGWGADVVAAGFRGAWTQPVLDSRRDSLLGLLVAFVPEARPPTGHERRVTEVASHLAAIAIERSGWQAELWRAARLDPLTALPNRTAIFEHLDLTLAGARVERLPVTAMLVDLDRFKLINDSLGHAVGDELLGRFADRLRSILDGRDFVGRMAADEFVVIFAPGVRLREAKLTARRLTRTLSEPFTVEDDDIHLTVSVGLAMSSQAHENADTLVQRADTAMFRAKALGRDRVEVYDERLRTRSVKRFEIDRELRLALERNELEVYYQPEVDCRTGMMVGAEALLRWHHRTRGLIQPDGFITIAEESGIIVPIGHWVLDEAVRQARAWVDAHPGHADFAISVNLSARQLINRSLVDTVAFVLTRYNWPPSQLTLELTESILIEDRDATLYVLNRLRMLGVKLAIDDFGTGFASLDYLHRLHVDWIKIDKSFVDLLDAEGNGSPVAAAIMHMAKDFKLSVIAEGVEEQRQFDGLKQLGCDIAQGFLFARPLPADEMEAVLRDNPTW